MPTISAINSFTKHPTVSRWLHLAKNYAKIIDSRESTYRTFLDLTAFDLPIMAAAAFRNFWNFLETTLEAAMGTISVIYAPKITTFVGNTLGKSIFKTEEERKNIEHYLRFHMSELSEPGTMKHAINSRLKKDEFDDQIRLSKIYKELGNKDRAEKFEERAFAVDSFFRDFNPDEEVRKKIYRLKRRVILGESFIEGAIWGGFGLIIRFFRKHILKVDRFTGTMGYLSEGESSGLGEDKELSLLQKIGGVSAMFLSPFINSILLKKTKDTSQIKPGSFLEIANKHLDMTHGVFPKLGLLFSYTSLPKWTGIFVTSQGWYERSERMLKFCTILPSWWLGHRVTNGKLAAMSDKYLSKKYGIKEGVLIEQEVEKGRKDDFSKTHPTLDKINKFCPEPAKYPHIVKRLDKIESEGIKNGHTKEDLTKEVEDLHAKCLYGGFALHSFLVWAVTMIVNYSTKLRTKHALGG